jgi:hypothetical protein
MTINLFGVAEPALRQAIGAWLVQHGFTANAVQLWAAMPPPRDLPELVRYLPDEVTISFEEEQPMKW